MKKQLLKTIYLLGILLSCLCTNNSLAQSFTEGASLSTTYKEGSYVVDAGLYTHRGNFSFNSTLSAGTSSGATVSHYANNAQWTSNVSPHISKSYVSSFSSTSAVMGGEISSDGGSLITERGIVWNTTGAPTTADNKVAMGTGTGSFSSTVTGLSSNTKIYHRAYATNSSGTFYGEQAYFTTTNSPTVITFDGADEDPISGMLYSTQFSGGGETFDITYSTGGIYYMEEYGSHNGLIAAYEPGVREVSFATKDGGEVAFNSIYFAMDYGVLNYTLKGYKDGTEVASQTFTITASDPKNPGFYSQEILLNTNFSDCDRMVLSVPSGSELFETYINYFSFSSSGSSTATVKTSSARFITNSSAILGGNITTDGGAPVTERGIVYDTISSPTISKTKIVMGSGTGSFNSEVAGLTLETKYYVRAYAVNEIGVSYGNQISFTTTATPSSIESITRSTGATDLVNTAEVKYNITFSENISGLSTSNFSLATTGDISGATISSVSGSGSSFEVVVNSGKGDGTIRLDMSNAIGVVPSISNVPFTGEAIYRIDKTAPVVSGVVAGNAYNTDRTITFNEGTATLNGNSFASGTIVSLEGAYELSVTDGAGNNTSVSFTIDKTAPKGNISLNDGAAYTKTENVIATLNFSDGSGVGGMQFRFSNDNSTWGAWETATTTKAITLPSGNGDKTIYVQFQDSIGNTSSSFSDRIFLDTTAPEGSLSINKGAANTNSPGVTLHITAQDTESAVNMRFSNDNSTWSTWEPAATTKAWTLPSGDGSKTVYMQLVDAAGNISETYQDDILLDTQAPAGFTVTFVEAVINNSNKQGISFSFSNAEVGTTYQYSISGSTSRMALTNSGTISSSEQIVSEIDASGFQDGTLTIYVTLTDAAGNISTITTDIINKDIVAPSDYSVSFDQKGINAVNAAKASFTFARAEIGTTYNYTITSTGGSGTVTGSGTINSANDQVSNIDLTSLKDGQLSLMVTLTDKAGNVGKPVTATLAKDMVLPTYIISSNERNPTNNKTIKVAVRFSELVSGFTTEGLNLANGTVTNLHTVDYQHYTFDLIPTSDGNVSVSVKTNAAHDKTGNGNSAGNTLSLLYDGTQPGLVISSSESHLTNKKLFTVHFVFDEEVTDFDIQDIRIFNGTTSGFVALDSKHYTAEVAPTNDGTLAIDVAANAAVDAAGNASKAALQFSIGYDGTAPEGYTVAIEKTIINSAIQKAFAFTILGAEPGTTYQYIISSTGGTGTISGSGSITSASLLVSNISLSNLADGTLTLIVTLTDAAGNKGPQVTATVNKDATAPIVVVQHITKYLDANGQVRLSVSEVDNGSYDNFGPITLIINKNSFNCSHLGENTVELKVSDEAGNVSLAVAKVTVADNTPPTAAMKDITIQLDANGEASIKLEDLNSGYTDNCSIASVVLDKTTFTCSNLGTNKVTLTLADQSGNITKATAKVVVEDVTTPVALTKNITVQLDENGLASITPADVDKGSSDNCSIVSMKLDKYSFGCENLGPNQLTFTITDAYGNKTSAQATVTVEDKVAPVIAQNQTFFLDENSVEGTVVGTVAVQDNCDQHQWTILSGNTHDAFVIDSNGVIKVNNATVLDYEQVTNFVLTIFVTDGINNSAPEEVVVQLKDINEYIPYVVEGISDQQVHENSNYTYAVSSATFADEDKDDKLTLSSPNLPSWLSFEPTSATFNGTPANDDVGSHTITLKATDKAGHFAELSFIIEVLNVNNAPHDIELSNSLIEENQPAGTFVGSFSTKDVDAVDAHTYSLVAGEGDVDNIHFYLEEDKLFTKQYLDYELKTSYSIRVTSIDREGATVEKILDIHIKDVEDVRAFLPNLFSPNGDNSNDRFILRTNGLKEVNFRIFDQKGKIVYETSDITTATTEGWDGNSKGEKVPSGTYVWQLSGKFHDGQSLSVDGKNVGNIVLIR